MLGTWTRKPSGNATVVFVHGILSSGETCWTNQSGHNWPELLQNEPELGTIGIYVFSYQTGIFSGSYSLGDSVDALKEHMRLDNVLKSQQLIFICHSMGGIVVRKFIVQNAVDLRDQGKEIGLYMVASPSLGATYADWLSPLAKLLGHRQADALRFIRNNEWLKDLDREFTNLKESRKLKIVGKELVEDRFVVLQGFWRRQVVEPFSGAKYFGEPYRVPASDHFSISKPVDKDAIQHRLLCRFIIENFLSPPSPGRTPVEVTIAPPTPKSNGDPHSGPASDRVTSTTGSGDRPTVSIISLSAVDEEALDAAVDHFGTDWPENAITWPQSCDKLVAVVREVLQRFDSDASSLVGADHFIELAPSALARATARKADMQKRLPRLIKRASGFDRDNLKEAIKSYLVLGNYQAHLTLIYLSSWDGFKLLKLEVPPGFPSFPTLHNEDIFARLFNEKWEIYHGRLHHIGDHEIRSSGTPYMQIYASKSVLYSYGDKISNPRDICRWLIPQVELELQDDALPSGYAGLTWEFSVIQNRKLVEMDSKGDPRP